LALNELKLTTIPAKAYDASQVGQNIYVDLLLDPSHSNSFFDQCFEPATVVHLQDVKELLKH